MKESFHEIKEVNELEEDKNIGIKIGIVLILIIFIVGGIINFSIFRTSTRSIEHFGQVKEVSHEEAQILEPTILGIQNKTIWVFEYVIFDLCSFKNISIYIQTRSFTIFFNVGDWIVIYNDQRIEKIGSDLD